MNNTITQIKYTQYRPDKYLSLNVVITILFFLIGLFICGSAWNGLAFAITSFFLLRFVYAMGNTIPIAELIISIASLQWLFGPALTYGGYSNHFKYYMYVSELDYYSYSIPGILLFYVGMHYFSGKKKNILQSFFVPAIRNHIHQHPKISNYLIIIGILASIMAKIVPASIGFFFGLISGSLYIGVIYLFFSESKIKWWGIALISVFLFISSLSDAMFHGLLIWLTFFALYIVIIKKFTIRVKLIYLIVGLCFAMLIQIVKGEFRNYVWGGYSGNKISLFFDLAAKQLENNSDEVSTEDNGIIIRLNQGWIISRIMDYIPDEEPYMNGETVINAVYSSLIPRVFDSEKTKVGGQSYFAQMTGFELTGTSMGASLLGEGYANYGIWGGLIFIFIIGSLYGWVLKKIYTIAVKYPTLLLWLPLIFLQVVKAESDLLRVLNYLTKASFVVYLIYWGTKQFTKYRL